MYKGKLPLVSILITNYNNSKYLQYCYESVLKQTYPNIEVISYDNQSTDNSYEIMLRYKQLFKERDIWMDVGMQKRNIGSSGNTSVCFTRSEGEFLVSLSSDDAIKPTFIEECMEIFLAHQSVGMVMVHRDEMDANGILSTATPFYNKSCIIPGESQAAVFMMAGIAVPSQIMMRRGIMSATMRKPLILQVAGDWLDNFIASCRSDVGYIKNALCEYRIHSNNDSLASEDNLVCIFEHYEIINAFTWIGESYGYKKHLPRFDDAIKKLAQMCFRYAYKMLKNEDAVTARRYLNLAPVFDEEIRETDMYKLFWECCCSDKISAQVMLKLESVFSKARTVSYDPPEDSIEYIRERTHDKSCI